MSTKNKRKLRLHAPKRRRIGQSTKPFGSNRSEESGDADSYKTTKKAKRIDDGDNSKAANSKHRKKQKLDE